MSSRESRYVKFRKTKVEVSHATTIAAWSVARSTILNRPSVFHPFVTGFRVSLSPVFGCGEVYSL